jgi:large subunit ribosomal protein LP2
MSLKYTASYLLNVLAGHERPTEKEMKKVIEACGSHANSEDIKLVLQHTEGKSTSELIKKGLTGLAASATAAPGPLKTPGSPKKSPRHGPSKSPKKDEKKVEEKDEDAGDMGFSLFD